MIIDALFIEKSYNLFFFLYMITLPGCSKKKKTDYTKSIKFSVLCCRSLSNWLCYMIDWFWVRYFKKKYFSNIWCWFSIPNRTIRLIVFETEICGHESSSRGFSDHKSWIECMVDVDLCGFKDDSFLVLDWYGSMNFSFCQKNSRSLVASRVIELSSWPMWLVGEIELFTVYKHMLNTTKIR